MLSDCDVYLFKSQSKTRILDADAFTICTPLSNDMMMMMITIMITIMIRNDLPSIHQE